MIVLYINEHKAQLVSASTGKDSVKIKFVKEVPINGNSIAAVSAMFEGIKPRDMTDVHIIVDSPEIQYREVKMPCINEKDLRKIIETEGVQSGKAVLNTADEIISVMERKVNKGVDTHGHLNIIPATIMLDIERIIKASNITVKSIVIAERVMDAYYAKCGGGLYAEQSILINYNNTFAGVAIYSCGNSLRHDSYRCEVGERGVLLPIVNMSHRAAVIAADDYKLHIEKIYVTGIFTNVMELLSNITEEVGIDTELLPMPRCIKGMTIAEYNNYINAVAGIVYVRELKK